MKQSLLNKEELPINTLDLGELLLQWKVMKGLGYKSLFDPDFRRELRNPLRRLMYYRIVVEEERGDKRFLTKSLEAVADRVSYFSDPELYHKVKDSENRNRVMENEGNNKYVDEMRRKGADMERKHSDMSDEDKQEAVALLNNT